MGKISNLAGANSFQTVVTAEQEKKIVFVLSLAGRYSTFVRFLRNYQEVCILKLLTFWLFENAFLSQVCLKSAQNTDLLIVFFEDKASLQPFFDALMATTEEYPAANINYLTISGNFSRGKALDAAARSNYISPSEIIFFIDVDMTFRQESLDRIRINTVQHLQVYLPIVFSQYDPHRVQSVYNVTTSNVFARTDDISYAVGYFRQFGYGICAIYKSDIMHPSIDGFNTDITGWGLEDVKFLEKIIRLNQRSPSILLNTADTAQPVAAVASADVYSSDLGDDGQKPIRLSVFRAPDPSLVHVYHAIECDRNLEESQYAMCIGTKANTLGSYKQIESVLLNNRSIIEYFSSVNSLE